MSTPHEMDCPLCRQEPMEHTELRIHLMVDHRKSTVIDEYVAQLDESTALVQ